MWVVQSVLVLALLLGIVASYPSNSRVVNGTDSDITRFPFIVSLRGPSKSHTCGASIISQNFILTAAHCVSGRTAKDISIQYASTEISASSPNVANVENIIMHEDYDPNNAYANDIALVKIVGRLIFNSKTIDAVTLPEAWFEIPQVAEGAPGVLAGWGRNATDGSIQRRLQEVALKIYSDDECNSRHNGVTTTNHICGGVDEGWKGQCSGDSGGPLLYNGNIQLGIVSWSIKPCAVDPYPGVYTKVSHYIDWIKRNMY